MRFPLTSDRLRDWISNSQKTNTMVIDPIEEEIKEEKDMDKQAFESLRQSYQYMMKVAASLQVQVAPQGHEDEILNQELASRFQTFQNAQKALKEQERNTTDPNMPARYGLLGGTGGALLGGGLGYKAGGGGLATLGALGGFIPGVMAGHMYGKHRHEQLYPGQMEALQNVRTAFDDVDMDLQDIAGLNPAAYRRARIMNGYKNIPAYDDDVEEYMSSVQEAKELKALRRRLEMEQQIKDEIAARQKPTT